VTPDGRELWTGNLGPKNITVVDLRTKEKVATLKAGTTPIYFVFSPDSKRAYVTNWDSNDVSVIATASRKVVASIPVPRHPIDLRLLPDGRLVVASGLKGDTGDHVVSVIDTAANKVVGRIEKEWKDPRYLALHPDGRRLFIASRGSNTVTVVEVPSLKVLKEFAGARNTGLIGLTAEGRLLYAVDRDAPAAVAIDTESGKVVATVPVGKKPFGLAVRRVVR
jgi:YVTN family beta-propeller protein